MQGHFDLQMLHTPKLTPRIIEQVRREGGDPAVEEYLRCQPKDDEWHMDNIVYQTTPSWFYWALMNGNTPYGGMQTSSEGGPQFLCAISLGRLSSEPTYTTDMESPYIQLTPGSAGVDRVAGTLGSKRFSTPATDASGCIVDPVVLSDASLREAIYIKSKWLFLPGECTDDQIRSIHVWWGSSWNYALNQGAARQMCRIARVRIKDSGGNPITINKIATKSLLVEYTFTMVSL